MNLWNIEYKFNLLFKHKKNNKVKINIIYKIL